MAVKPHVFISYANDDAHVLNDVKSNRLNPNNLIDFVDRSLAEPVYNEHGHINRRLPSDPAAAEVRNKIFELLKQSGKLLALIGPNTHSHEWVKWEIDTFFRIHRDTRGVLLMRIPGDYSCGKPNNAKGLPICNWDVAVLHDWLSH